MNSLAWKTSIWLVAVLTLFQSLSGAACCCPLKAVHADHPVQHLSCPSSVEAAGQTDCTCPDTCCCKLGAASGHLLPATPSERVNRSRWHSQDALELSGMHDCGHALQRSSVTARPILCATVSRTCVDLCRFQL